MKKLLLVFLTSFLTLFAFSTPTYNDSIPFPNYQMFGSPTTLTDFKGAPRGIKGIITGRYADTLTANTTSSISFYPGASIVTDNPRDVVWLRNYNATQWLFAGGSGSGSITNIFNNSSTNISIINDTTIQICTGAGSCDTFHINNTINNISTVGFIDSSHIVVCAVVGVTPDSSTSVCDTFSIPAQKLYVFQSGVGEPSAGIVELGDVYGQNLHGLLHDTRINTNARFLFMGNFVATDNTFPRSGFLGGTVQWQQGVYNILFQQGQTNLVSYPGVTGTTGYDGGEGMKLRNDTLSGNVYPFPSSTGDSAYKPFNIYWTNHSGVEKKTFYIDASGDPWSDNIPFVAKPDSLLAIHNGHFVSTSNSTSTIEFHDTTVIICSFGTQLCDTNYFTNVGVIQNVFLHRDTLIVCGTITCDTAIISGLGGITAITANNGTSTSSPTNVQLGATASGNNSPLLHNTYINTTANYSLEVNGSIPIATAAGIFRVVSTAASSINDVGLYAEMTSGTGRAIRGVSTNGYGVDGNGGNVGVQGQSSGGTGVYATTSNGQALFADGNNGLPAQIQGTPASTNSTVAITNFFRGTQGTAAAGLGGILNLKLQDDAGFGQTANQLIWKWTNAGTSTYTSQFIITGVNSAAISDLFTLSGNGSLKLNKYGIGTFTGTPAYTLQVDASGNVIEGTSSSIDSAIWKNDGIYTNSHTLTAGAFGQTFTFNSLAGASGLTLSSTSTAAASNLQKVVVISLSGANATASQNTYSLYTTNSHSGTSNANWGVYSVISNEGSTSAAIYGEANSQYGVYGSSSSGIATYGSSTSSYGIAGLSITGVAGNLAINPSSTNSIATVLNINRNTQGTAANGIGAAIDFFNESSTTTRLSGRVASTLTDVTDATHTGDLQFYTTNSGSSTKWMTISGAGAVQMNSYGAGTATFDASGNITSVSDERLKNISGYYKGGLNELMNINPIVYKWNEKSKLETKHSYIGFSAQNIQSALGNDAVGVNAQGYMSIQDRAILAILVNAIREQQQEIEQLKRMINKK